MIDKRILISLGKTGQHSQSLSAVVRFSFIIRRTIFHACPETFVEISFHPLHDSLNHLGIFCLLKYLSKLEFALQRQIIPSIQQQVQVDVTTPVSPRPISLASNDQPVIVQLPNIVQITLHAIVYHRDKAAVSTIEVEGTEAIISDRCQHLSRQFITPVPCRTRRENHVVFTLPSHQFMDSFVGQAMSFQVGSIKGFTQFVHFIAPPLRAFTIRTIHVSITHRYIQGTDSFLTQTVQERIVTGKSAGKLRIVSGLTIFQGIYLHSFRNQINHGMSIHPA